jgi:hypothetical protein
MGRHIEVDLSEGGHEAATPLELARDPSESLAGVMDTPHRREFINPVILRFARR